MHLACPICSDLFVPSAEVDITPCGHMFHHLCLLQWLERSKTCPQCRNRCTEARLVKVYFNVTTSLDTTEDNAALLEKLDNLTLKVREQQKQLKTFEDKVTEHKGEQKKMRKTLLGLEEELRTKNTALFALKHETDMLRGDRKMLGKVQEELESVKTKLQSYAVVKQAIEATAQEVEQMLTSDMSRQAVIALATALKRELQAQEIKRKEQSDRLKRLQNELVEERRKRKTLEDNLSTCDSEIYRLEQLLKQKAKEASTNTSTEESIGSPDGCVPNTPDQRPTVGRKRPMQDLNSSTPLSEKVRKIVNSNSPYLRVKTSSIGLAPLMRGGLSANPQSAASIAAEPKPKPGVSLSSKYSIFSNPRLTATVSGFTTKPTVSRPVQNENHSERKEQEEAESTEPLAGPRYKLTSATVTARLKSGKLTRHPSTVSSSVRTGDLNAIFDLDVDDIIE
ncbi:AGAP006611-PA [Anopheles gambiae str. PEST]|uniref:AGAP006611-PA n=1 Tax=Anopheles gambiae TaxID=7165 RepID=Q7Q568_ANOGA|nr:AGAP006611-PA [Anopheles gambiae str. PEST]